MALGILALALALGSIGGAAVAAMGHASSHSHGKVANSDHWIYTSNHWIYVANRSHHRVNGSNHWIY